jgi:8-hydroxy-5-deazaflavin:NADPH oxidoreductase
VRRHLAWVSVRVAIIGAGSLGQAVGARLLEVGHELLFGGGASAQEAASRLGTSAGSNADAAAFGEVVALCVPFAHIAAAIEQAGSLDGVVLWSCVNASKPDLSGLAIGFDRSAAEEVASRAPGARVVAAIPPFAEALNNGDLLYDCGLSPSVFVCGDDRQANALVELLVFDIGAQPVDAGPLVTARLAEPAMMLVTAIAYAGIPRDVGLRLLERAPRQELLRDGRRA